MGDAVQKVSAHLRRVGRTRWHVSAYERSGMPRATNGTESEVQRLIRKAQGKK